MNKIEKLRSGEDPDHQARLDLVDSLFEPKKTFTLEAPELDLYYTA